MIAHLLSGIEIYLYIYTYVDLTSRLDERRKKKSRTQTDEENCVDRKAPKPSSRLLGATRVDADVVLLDSRLMKIGGYVADSSRKSSLQAHKNHNRM